MAYLRHSCVGAMKVSVKINFSHPSVVQRLQSKRGPNLYATLQAKFCILKMQTAQEWGLR